LLIDIESLLTKLAFTNT